MRIILQNLRGLVQCDFDSYEIGKTNTNKS